MGLVKASTGKELKDQAKIIENSLSVKSDYNKGKKP